jgi:uncharacterized damage-inducible protein DinB
MTKLYIFLKPNIMYSKIKDFITDWNEESANTLRVFSGIPNEVKSVKDHENIRSLERLAWHITQTVSEMPKSCGITDVDPLANKDVPTEFEEIVDLYSKHSKNLIEIVKEKWNDDDLTKKLEIYGEVWEARKILAVLIKHEIHHRAQMTVIMRLLNLSVPGVYGPSKEEWSKYGAEAQE